MSRDIFDDRNGFAAARHAFVHHQPGAPLTLEGFAEHAGPAARV